MIVSLALALMMLALPSMRQAAGPPIVIGHERSMPSEALGREITLDVSRPPGYGDQTARYPVLYTFQSFFHHVSGVADYLANINAAPDMIVVSVRNYSSAAAPTSGPDGSTLPLRHTSAPTRWPSRTARRTSE